MLDMQELSRQIYSVLTSRNFRKAQPADPQGVLRNIASAVERNSAIPLVAFWGMGNKELNWAEKETCSYLLNLNKKVQEIYSPGLDFTFVLSEPHGVHNGIPDDVIEKYTSAVRNLFSEFGFKARSLHELWRQYGISHDLIHEVWQTKDSTWWEQIPNRELFEKSASRRNKRVTSQEAAQKYYIFRDMEKEVMKTEFTDSIFHTFSDTRVTNVLPNMPTLFFFSRKRGVSDTPWFVDSK